MLRRKYRSETFKTKELSPVQPDLLSFVLKVPLRPSIFYPVPCDRIDFGTRLQALKPDDANNFLKKCSNMAHTVSAVFIAFRLVLPFEEGKNSISFIFIFLLYLHIFNTQNSLCLGFLLYIFLKISQISALIFL